MEVVDEGEVPRIVGVNFLSLSEAIHGEREQSNSHIVRRHLHPLLKVGEQRHDALHGGNGGTGHIGHVDILRGRVGTVLPRGEGNAAAARRPRGAKRVALLFVERMAAVGLFLAVVVERHSCRG